MKKTIITIIQIDDMLYELLQYLSFESKVLFGKAFNINFLKHYDFNDNQFEKIDYFVNYEKFYYDWIYEFVNDNRYRLEDEYFEYRKENYFLEDYDYINDCYNEYKDDDDTCSDITYNNYSFTSCDKSCMNDELEELIKNSFLYIYSRKLIEIVE